MGPWPSHKPQLATWEEANWGLGKYLVTPPVGKVQEATKGLRTGLASCVCTFSRGFRKQFLLPPFTWTLSLCLPTGLQTLNPLNRLDLAPCTEVTIYSCCHMSFLECRMRIRG